MNQITDKMVDKEYGDESDFVANIIPEQIMNIPFEESVDPLAFSVVISNSGYPNSTAVLEKCIEKNDITKNMIMAPKRKRIQKGYVRTSYMIRLNVIYGYKIHKKTVT